MWPHRCLAVGWACCLTSGAWADVLITYTSEEDLDPTTADIDLYRGDAATITIDMFALGDEYGMSAAGFSFAGMNMGGGVLVNGTLTMSSFRFREYPFQDPNSWFANNDLPNPLTVTFFGFVPFPVNALATFSLEVLDDGGSSEYSITQTTAPVGADENVLPLHFTDDSDSFRVHVLPEPGMAFLLAGVLASSRRLRSWK